MNYELAKKLKEAGFPQNPKGHSEAPDSWINSRGELLDFQTDVDETETYIPTLTELIEACGDVVFTLSRDLITQAWWATAFNNKGKDEHANGEIPEEAVANLWLALQDKK